MFRDKERYGQDPNVVVLSRPATFDAPLRWQREAERGDRTGSDRFVFTCSWSDWFVEEADPWRDDAWAIIRACPLLTFQILTKRSHRIGDHLPADWLMPGPGGTVDGWPNAWIGVSVEDQATADVRIGDLAQVIASVRFLSVEPLLDSVDLNLERFAIPKHRVQWPVERNQRWWTIVGGESGNRTGKYQARPCELAWIRDVVRQCREAGIPCFVKQLGSCATDPENGIAGACLDVHPDARGLISRRLRDPHGGDWDEWPDDLRVREWPTIPDRVAASRPADLPGQGLLFGDV